MSEDERDETVGQVIKYNNNKISEQNDVSKYLNEMKYFNQKSRVSNIEYSKISCHQM